MELESLKVFHVGHFHHFPDHLTERDDPKDHLIIWVIGGRGWARSEKRVVDAQTGSLLLFEKGVPHGYGSDRQQPWDILWSHFNGSEAVAYLNALREAGGDMLRVRLGLDEVIRQRWMEMLVIQETSGPAFCSHLLHGALGLMIRRLQLLQLHPAPAQLEMIQRLQRWIGEHLSEPISVEQLAKVACTSPRQLSRLFAQAVNSSPMRYVIDQRIARACVILSESAATVQQVAYAVGFDNPYYFSRQFHRRIGCSPSAYRAQRQGSGEHARWL